LIPRRKPVPSACPTISAPSWATRPPSAPGAFSFIAYCNTADGNPIAVASVNITALSGNPSGSLSPFGFELTAPFAAIPNTVNLNVFLFRSLSVSFCDNSSFT
jgi:hypothetical protein